LLCIPQQVLVTGSVLFDDFMQFISLFPVVFSAALAEHTLQLSQLLWIRLKQRLSSQIVLFEPDNPGSQNA
jgi:hypothetical protein